MRSIGVTHGSFACHDDQCSARVISQVERQAGRASNSDKITTKCSRTCCDRWDAFATPSVCGAPYRKASLTQGMLPCIRSILAAIRDISLLCARSSGVACVSARKLHSGRSAGVSVDACPTFCCRHAQHYNRPWRLRRPDVSSCESS